MQNSKRAVLLVSALLVTGFFSVRCAPAKWAEQNVDGNSGQQLPGGGGQAGKPAADTFVQDSNANKVDILIINDNSASMDEEQQKMSTRFNSFVSDLKGLDYRIAMTTTDIDSPKYGLSGRIVTWADTAAKVLTPSTPNAEAKFKKTIVRTETIGCTLRDDCPSKDEQPLKAIELAVDQSKTANKEFFREGVDFVAVVLSDEDELSTAPSNATTAAYVVDHFKNLFGDTKRFAVHGLIVVPNDKVCLRAQSLQGPEGSKAAYGTRVASLAGLTKGSVNSICDADYAKDLASISSEVRKLVSSFELRGTPVTDSVRVALTPTFQTTWTTEGNRLIFTPAPPAGTKIEVTYSYE